MVALAHLAPGELKMRLRVLAAIAGAMSVSACATTDGAAPVAANPFDAAALEWSRGAGQNAIKGSAILRTRGGDVKTCAGLTARLIPASAHTTEYVKNVYGPGEKGLENPYAWLAKRALNGGVADYVRTTTCNPQGEFGFSGLPDGKYYVEANVSWEAPSRYGMTPQGGNLVSAVDLKGGETKSIVLTQ